MVPQLLDKDEQNRESSAVLCRVQGLIQKIVTGMDRRGPVIFVGMCHKKKTDLSPAVARMFVRTTEFKPMSAEESCDTLEWLVDGAGRMICSREELREKISGRVTGFLYADLVKLVRLALKFKREEVEGEKEETEETEEKENGIDSGNGNDKRSIRTEHFVKGIGVLETLYSDSVGSAKIPSVHWDDVGGLENLKEEVSAVLNFPMKYPNWVDSRLRCSGFLFYGPPGTGKTLMAKAIATEFNYRFLSVKGPELMNSYVGQSEKNVRDVFERARAASPCIIFFDELDSLAPKRGQSVGNVTDRIVSQLLTEMDGLEPNSGVFVIAATNRPDLVDPAFLRPGRFDKMFYVGLCESDTAKLSVFRALTRKFALAEDVDLEAVVGRIYGPITGADAYSICSGAWLSAARKQIKRMEEEGVKAESPVVVASDDFTSSLADFVPSLTPDLLAYYEQFRRTKETAVSSYS